MPVNKNLISLFDDIPTDQLITFQKNMKELFNYKQKHTSHGSSDSIEPDASSSKLIAINDTIGHIISSRQTTKQTKIPVSSSDSTSLFKPVKKSAQLMQFVINANYEAIEHMWNKNPKWMLHHVNVLRTDGTNEYITPLQKAFELYDTYTWKRFYEIIKNQPELVHKFHEQALLQTYHLDLTPLFMAYKSYVTGYNRWLHNKISNTLIDNLWLKLGKKQKELLPAHMLKEFCREGNSWKPRSSFDISERPAPTSDRIYHYAKGEDITLGSKELNSGLGVDFAFWRCGVRPTGAANLWRDAAVWWANQKQKGDGMYDLMTFYRLYITRKNEFTMLLNKPEDQLTAKI